MTPAARVQAAIEVLDRMIAGAPAEQALTRWARSSRFAGSGDRAAVRDHVFGAWRRRRSLAALGGSETGRGLMIGALRSEGHEPQDIFGAGQYAPAALADDELETGRAATSDAERLDIPDWLWPRFCESMGADAEGAARALQNRAGVHLRVNLRKATRDSAMARLSEAGITCQPHPASPTALEVVEGARRIRSSEAFTSGLVELQDAASQAVVDSLPLRDGMRVLDYCAGGGGKSLAMAARARLCLWAHDAAAQRMRDLPARAKRAGVDITPIETRLLDGSDRFDLVLCDVPCSGSGSWRRSPEGKWTLDEQGLQVLLKSQRDILRRAAGLVADGGTLVYVTCSVLNCENGAQISRFVANNPDWVSVLSRQWPIDKGTDGFFTTHLTRR